MAAIRAPSDTLRVGTLSRDRGARGLAGCSSPPLKTGLDQGAASRWPPMRSLKTRMANVRTRVSGTPKSRGRSAFERIFARNKALEKLGLLLRQRVHDPNRQTDYVVMRVAPVDRDRNAFIVFPEIIVAVRFWGNGHEAIWQSRADGRADDPL